MTARLLSCVSAALLGFYATGAQALKINLVNIGGVEQGTAAYGGFSSAARYWESVIADDVTATFQVSFSPLPAGTLGEATSSTVVRNTVSVQNAIRAAATSSLDALVAAGLPTVPNTNFRLNTTVARALGFVTMSPTDATIAFNSTAAFDFDTRDGFTGVSSDFVGAAVHEMGHALGFTSGAGRATPENIDMFRFAGPGQWSFAYGQEAYFSYDGGATELFGNADFSTGADGRQVSHWKDRASALDGAGCTIPVEPQIGIMDPSGGLCQEAVVTAQDLAAFDALGWTLREDISANPGYSFRSSQIVAAFGQPVPEPATWAMLALGFGLAGVTLRRRPATVAA